ncbi:MAG: hypothetical protein ACQEP1_01370 [Nanobdellota archaeon]
MDISDKVKDIGREKKNRNAKKLAQILVTTAVTGVFLWNVTGDHYIKSKGLKFDYEQDTVNVENKAGYSNTHPVDEKKDTVPYRTKGIDYNLINSYLKEK